MTTALPGAAHRQHRERVGDTGDNGEAAGSERGAEALLAARGDGCAATAGTGTGNSTGTGTDTGRDTDRDTDTVSVAGSVPPVPGARGARAERRAGIPAPRARDVAASRAAPGRRRPR